MKAGMMGMIQPNAVVAGRLKWLHQVISVYITAVTGKFFNLHGTTFT